MRAALLLEVPEEYKSGDFLSIKKAGIRVWRDMKLRRGTLPKIYV